MAETSRKTDRRFGDFELLQRIGRDGPFHLFRARQVSLDRKVILKVLPERAAMLERTALLRREAEGANRLDHPGILRAFDVGDVGGAPYLALAFSDGELLSERLKAGPLKPRLAVDLTRQLAEALLYAHEHALVHGALRPEVVWLTRDKQARLAGFGAPLRFEEIDLEETAGFAGFLAPEQAGGRGSVRKATDVYGLGALFYAMLTGSPPHRGATPSETFRLIRSQPPPRPSRLRPGLSPILDAICLKCLSFSLARRYGTERPLQRLIAELRRASGAKADRESWDEIGPWLRRHGRLVRIASLLLLFAIIPACWDRRQHHAAWNTLTHAEQPATEYLRAARHFDQLRADAPFDVEAIAGQELAEVRVGKPLVESGDARSWSRDLDEWAAVRKLTRVLAESKGGQREQAKLDLEAARHAGYVPRSDIERRLLAEIEEATSERPAERPRPGK